MENDYLESSIKQFEYYKLLGEKAIAQLPDNKLFWQYNEASNSIAIIVQHLWGNMLSRWTDFLTSDGEKDWRNRDAEFENIINTKEQLLGKWNEGWDCLLNALKPLTGEDLQKIFQPFFTARKKAGMGLGLSISERIIKNHGGKIEVDSEQGQGTRFRIRLPVQSLSQ